MADAKFSDASVLDALLNKIATSVNITVCSAQPANYAGIAAVTLATTTLTSGDFSTGASGLSQVLTIAQKSSISITTSGTAVYIALDDGVTFLEGTLCTSQALTSGGTVTIPSWTVTATQPT